MNKTNVRVVFVVPEDCESDLQCSEVMQQAFEACRQNGINTEWCSENQCIKLKLSKTDFMVFQEFEGGTFEKVKETKSVRIVGPWCLLTCLTEGKQIPNVSWPVFSVAAIGCTIACSSLSKGQKKDLQTKIEYMGGFFSSALTDNCTHLVTDSVKSEKYIKAAEVGVKLYLSAWVEDVWQASHKSNVHCNDKQFEKHRCPTFYKLVVCCTGLSIDERAMLMKMVTENGGVYREQLHVNSTDILVCNNASVNSAKYKAAKKRNIKCVTFKWATDSIKNGYAMPDNLYPIKIGTSTPTKESENINPNFSTISHIENSAFHCNRSVLMNTINMTDTVKIANDVPVKSTAKRKSDSNEHNDLVNNIDMKQVKMAGPFLDGCGVYLVGFGTEQREKLCKVLNFSGATRYDDITERVTHVIVGDTSCHDLKLMHSKGTLKNCALVGVQWLLDSIEKKCPADEEPYAITSISNKSDGPSSPLSKKSLRFLRADSFSSVEKPLNTPVALAPPEQEPEVDLVQHYLRTDASSQEDTLAKLLQNNDQFSSKQSMNETKRSVAQQPNDKSKDNSSVNHRSSSASSKDDASLSSAVDESSQPVEPIYEGLTFIVVGFTEEQQDQVKLAIESMSGKVMSKLYKGIPDYAVVPVFSSELVQAATEVVTDLWISECWQENEIRPVEYFHRPISIKEDVAPLKDCVVTISSYVNYERNFLKNLIIQLGGISQEQFSRINSSNTGVVASTHLVSPEANGRKYAAAIKWGLPVVNKDWLLECAHTSQLQLEGPFLVGDSKCPPRKTSIDFSTINTETTTVTTTAVPINSNINIFNLKPSTPNVNNVDVTDALPRNLEITQTRISSIQQSGANSPFVKNKLNSTSSDSPHTPVNKTLKNVHNTSDVYSQVTPVQKIIAEARKNNLLGTPQESLPFPKPWDHVDTPETPLGAFINANPSPNLRKQMVRFLNTLPEHKRRRDSTPLSELKRKLWDKICPPKDSEGDDRIEQPNFDTEADADASLAKSLPDTSKSTSFNLSDNIINNQLQQLQDMLTSSGCNKTNAKRQSIIPVAAVEVKDSQPNTVGWDDCMEYEDVQKPKTVPVFMFSGIEQEVRDSLATQLESLGANVTNSTNFDPQCTHLICPKPVRNEKILACIASGKWILHPSYVDKCTKEGKLVDEEPFEYGNPKSKQNIQVNKENEARVLAMHYWRIEIARRGYGPFHDMRVIVFAEKKDPIVRIVHAGGGMVVDVSPPFVHTVHATHCLLEVKSVKNISDYIPLAKQGIYCVNTLYVSEFLQRTAGDVRDYIVPALAEFYNSR